MAVIQLGRSAKRDTRKGNGGAASPAPAQTLGQKVALATDAVAQFIPADLLGLYIAGAAFLGPLTPQGSWTLMVVCLLLIPVLFFLGAKIPAIPNAKWSPPELHINILLMLCSALAFAAWVCALPQGPFFVFWADNAPKYGAFAVLALSIILPLAARKFGLIEST